MVIQFLDKFINKLIVANKTSFGNKPIRAILNFLKKPFPIFSSDIEKYLKAFQETSQKKLFQPTGFIFQWHITERCNWHCKHCYQEDKISADLSLEQLFQIFEQFLFLVKKWRFPPGRCFVAFSGGEPLVRKDFFQLLEKVGQGSRQYGYGCSLMSNGSLFTEENLGWLKTMGLGFIQVSLDGMEKENDKIRGEGAFQKAVNGIRLVRKSGIPVRVSFTFHKENIKDTEALLNLCSELGVYALGVRRLVPTGRGKELAGLALQPRELRKYYLNLKNLNKKRLLKISNRPLTKIDIGCEGSIFYSELLTDPLPGMASRRGCGLVSGAILTIMANGDILPCRRLPIVLGNALKDNVYDIYYSQLMQDLRDFKKIHPFCQKCPNFYNCFGGAKCITYASTGRWDLPDPRCWRAYKSSNEPNF